MIYFIISSLKFETCKSCNGTGQVLRVTNTILGQMQTATTCQACNGTGKSNASVSKWETSRRGGGRG